MKTSYYICISIAILIIALYLSRNKIKSALTRAYKNNNPGNIRPDGKMWIGEKPHSTDPGFKQFVSMPYGYRAMFVNIKGYLANGLNTIEKIISSWAPPKDGNDTAAYITAVSKFVGKNPTDRIVWTDTPTIRKIVTAISKQESGITPNMDDIDEGYKIL